MREKIVSIISYLIACTTGCIVGMLVYAWYGIYTDKPFFITLISGGALALLDIIVLSWSNKNKGKTK